MRVLRPLVGLLVSAVALWIVASRVDLEATGAILREAAPAGVAAMLGAFLVDVLVRARRWQLLLAPIRSVAYATVLASVFVGYLANNVLPARLGEVVRSTHLGGRTGVGRATALGTVVVERAVDTAMVVGIAGLAVLALRVSGPVASAVAVGLVVAGVLTVAIAVAVAAHRLPGATTVARLAARWALAGALAAKVRHGLAVAGRPRTLGAAVALSAAAWAMSAFAFLLAGAALGVTLAPAEALLFATGVALATAVPAGPGYVGTFELAGVAVGTAVGLPAAESLALTVLAHVGILAFTSIGGVIALLRTGWAPPVASDTAPGGVAATPTAPAVDSRSR